MKVLRVLPLTLVITILWAIVFSCSSTREQTMMSEQDVAIAWADMTLYVTKFTPENSPTFASRCLGYIGLTMYESIVPGYADYQSLAGQLNGLESLPSPELGADYAWVLALNSGQAEILRTLYIQTSDENKDRIDSLESAIREQYIKMGVTSTVADRSARFGKLIARAIFNWSVSDGGHRGYLANFDKKLVTPKGNGYWEPPLYGQSFSHFPLHPYWGRNRTFLQVDAEMETPRMLTWNNADTSRYHREFLEVFEKNKVLTQEEKEIALWWGDDPGETFTPPGHSYYLGTLAVKSARPDLIVCSGTYARIGLAVADAFINCWKWKYHYHSERPSSFITTNIDERWESFWPDPPFPAFPSGHAIQAAACATVLEALYGEQFDFTDDAHVGRKPDELRKVEFRPRSFRSFWQVAEETARSRFFGGIHSPQDNEAGLAQGRLIGQHVNQLHWKRDSQYAGVR
jgi:hypothetical protein